jgi:hypothetical protein
VIINGLPATAGSAKNTLPYVPTLGREEARPLGDDTPQVDKFRELARELECDDDEDAFDERLKKLATAPKEPKTDPEASGS